VRPPVVKQGRDAANPAVPAAVAVAALRRRVEDPLLLAAQVNRSKAHRAELEFPVVADVGPGLSRCPTNRRQAGARRCV
jgi:hypothetical protein